VVVHDGERLTVVWRSWQWVNPIEGALHNIINKGSTEGTLKIIIYIITYLLITCGQRCYTTSENSKELNCKHV
jgi:hypothetical protein